MTDKARPVFEVVRVAFYMVAAILWTPVVVVVGPRAEALWRRAWDAAGI